MIINVNVTLGKGNADTGRIEGLFNVFFGNPAPHHEHSQGRYDVDPYRLTISRILSAYCSIASLSFVKVDLFATNESLFGVTSSFTPREETG